MRARVFLGIMLKQKKGNEPAAARNDVFSRESKKKTKRGEVHRRGKAKIEKIEGEKNEEPL